MIAKALTRSTAEQWLMAKRSGQPVSGSPYEIGTLPRGDLDERIEDLATAFATLIGEVSELAAGVRPGRFDSHGSELIHRLLADLPLQIAADRDFWRYLSCGPLFEVVNWRYDGSGSLNNFGLGKLWGALPERLWFRAHVSAASETDDLYELTRRGTIDFWSSGPIAHLFGCNNSLVRALVRFQFPEDGEFTRAGGYRPQTLKFDGVRELFTRLNHFNAILEFGALKEDEAFTLIEELAADLPREEP